MSLLVGHSGVKSLPVSNSSLNLNTMTQSQSFELLLMAQKYQLSTTIQLSPLLAMLSSLKVELDGGWSNIYDEWSKSTSDSNDDVQLLINLAYGRNHDEPGLGSSRQRVHNLDDRRKELALKKIREEEQILPIGRIDKLKGSVKDLLVAMRKAIEEVQRNIASAVRSPDASNIKQSNEVNHKTSHNHESSPSEAKEIKIKQSQQQTQLQQESIQPSQSLPEQPSRIKNHSQHSQVSQQNRERGDERKRYDEHGSINIVYPTNPLINEGSLILFQGVRVYYHHNNQLQIQWTEDSSIKLLSDNRKRGEQGGVEEKKKNLERGSKNNNTSLSNVSGDDRLKSSQGEGGTASSSSQVLFNVDLAYKPTYIIDLEPEQRYKNLLVESITPSIKAADDNNQTYQMTVADSTGSINMWLVYDSNDTKAKAISKGTLIFLKQANTALKNGNMRLVVDWKNCDFRDGKITGGLKLGNNRSDQTWEKREDSL